DRLVAVIEEIGVFTEQEELFGDRNLDHHPAAARAHALARANATLPEERQRRRKAGGEQQQGDRDEAGDEITHHALRFVSVFPVRTVRARICGVRSAGAVALRELSGRLTTPAVV